MAMSGVSSLVRKPKSSDSVPGDVEKQVYLCLGHVTRDVHANRSTFGGTAYYSSLTAAALGYRAVVITRMKDSDIWCLRRECPAVDWFSESARTTTTFENVYGSSGRSQFVHGRAPRLHVRQLIGHPISPSIMHLGPILSEIGPQIVAAVAGRSFVALTGQGLLRSTECDGRVRRSLPRSASQAFAIADISVLSTEDVGGDRAVACNLLSRSRAGVLTDGDDVIQAHECGRWFKVPVDARPNRNPTGVGDIFASVLFTRYKSSGDLEAAIAFSSDAAARWVSAPGPGRYPRLEDDLHPPMGCVSNESI